MFNNSRGLVLRGSWNTITGRSRRPIMRLDGDWFEEGSLFVFREFCRLLESGSIIKGRTKYPEIEHTD